MKALSSFIYWTTIFLLFSPTLSQITTADVVLLPIKFQKGWNGFSLPVKPLETNLDIFFQETKNGPMWRFTDGHYIPSESIEPNVGYWVFLERDLNLVFSGDPAELLNEPRIFFRSGWTIFGVRSPVSVPITFSLPVWRYTGDSLKIIQDRLNPGEVFGSWFNDTTQIDLGSIEADADGDRIPDYWEFFWGLDFESDADGKLDSDTDGLHSLFEFRAGTDPTKPDTDGDGLPDDQEVTIHRTDPRLGRHR